MSDMSGSDYLMAWAEQFTKDEILYAADFRDMIFARFVMPPILPSTAVAHRSLEPKEEAPVGIVFQAFKAAKEAGDDEAMVEIVLGGLNLLAKFPEFMDMRVDPNEAEKI